MEIDAKNFDSIASNIFKPVYPVIARQITARTGITSGTCLDIGCGSGYLGAALASYTQLFMYFLDQSADMIEITKRTIRKNNLRERAVAILGDVSSIDLMDNSINLAISRGSVFFWEDLSRAFREIYRVLSPNGWAYIGGGFGSKELKNSIEQEMTSRQKGEGPFKNKMHRNLGPKTRIRFEKALYEAHIPSFTILQSEDIGLWILIRK